jgi:hypothetical protein
VQPNKPLTEPACFDKEYNMYKHSGRFHQQRLAAPPEAQSLPAAAAAGKALARTTDTGCIHKLHLHNAPALSLLPHHAAVQHPPDKPRHDRGAGLPSWPAHPTKGTPIHVPQNCRCMADRANLAAELTAVVYKATTSAAAATLPAIWAQCVRTASCAQLQH